MSVPVLAIKEANEHLQALFVDIQKKDNQIDELTTSLKEARDENITLNEHVKAVDERVVKLQAEHADELKKWEEKFAHVVSEHQKFVEETNHLHEIKVGELQKAIDEERKKVAEIESEMQRVLQHVAQNTKTREENVSTLSDIFKSTIKNMTLSLSITSKEEFVRGDLFTRQNSDEVVVGAEGSDSAYSSEIHLVEGEHTDPKDDNVSNEDEIELDENVISHAVVDDGDAVVVDDGDVVISHAVVDVVVDDVEEKSEDNVTSLDDSLDDLDEHDLPLDTSDDKMEENISTPTEEIVVAVGSEVVTPDVVCSDVVSSEVESSKVVGGDGSTPIDVNGIPATEDDIEEVRSVPSKTTVSPNDADGVNLCNGGVDVVMVNGVHEECVT